MIQNHIGKNAVPFGEEKPNAWYSFLAILFVVIVVVGLAFVTHAAGARLDALLAR
jgi:hypothetical protein